MFPNFPLLQGPLGLDKPQQVEQDFITTIEAAVGDVLQLDLAQAHAGTSDGVVGRETSGMARLVAPTAEGVKSGIHVVVLEAGPAGAKINCLLQGEVDAFMLKASGNIAIGDNLVITTAKNLSTDTTAGSKFAGWAKQALASPSTRTKGRVLFCGYSALGVAVA